MQKRGVCQGGKGGVLALAPPSAGVLPAGRRTERGRPKAAPWGTIFPDPISFDSAKRNGGKSHPGFSGQGFALRRVSFCAHKKKPKMRRGLGADELQAPRARSRSKRLHPRTPVFTGAQDRMMHPSISGVEVIGRSLPPFPLTAPLALVAIHRAHRERLPAPDGTNDLLR